MLDLTDVGRVLTWRMKAREVLAALAHEQWAGWTQWMLSKLSQADGSPEALDGDLVAGKATATAVPVWTDTARYWLDRWARQLATSYAELPEDEKESDRREADRVLATVAELLKTSGRLDEVEELPVDAVTTKIEPGIYNWDFVDATGSACFIQDAIRSEHIMLGQRTASPATHMILDREQVGQLLPLLHHFVRTGELPRGKP